MPGGRPTKYQPEYSEQVIKLCRLGATDRQLADFFGVAETTINNWKLDNPKFLESLKAGKALADAEVADSLYHRARGYSHPDVHITNYGGGVTETPFTKYYPPDTTACIFWLKNRRPDVWRDRRDFTLEQQAPRTVGELSNDELAAIVGDHELMSSNGTDKSESP